MRLILTQGQTSDHTQAHALIQNIQTDFVITDKGYDSDGFVQIIKANGATPVIPPQRNRKSLRYYDKHLYKARNLVECFFQKIKNFHRIVTRYERLARNHTAMLYLVATMMVIMIENAAYIIATYIKRVSFKKIDYLLNNRYPFNCWHLFFEDIVDDFDIEIGEEDKLDPSKKHMQISGEYISQIRA